MNLLKHLGLGLLSFAMLVHFSVNAYSFNCGSSCGDCPDNWKSRNGYCYRYFAAQITQNDAEVACEKLGANLVSFGDSGDEFFVKGLIVHANPAPVQASSTSINYLLYFIGMRLTYNSAGAVIGCSYTDGTSCSTYQSQNPLVVAPGSGQWCKANQILAGTKAEPKGISTTDNCVVWVFNSNVEGCWATMNCNDPSRYPNTAGYVCKFARPGVTPVPPSNMQCSVTGFIASNGKCYNAKYDASITNYAGAQAACATLGGNLTSILCYAEQFFIEGMLAWKQGNPFASPGYYLSYIGLKYVRDASTGVVTGCNYQDGSQVTFANPTEIGFMGGDDPYCDGSEINASGPKDPINGAPNTIAYMLRNSVYPGGWISRQDGTQSLLAPSSTLAAGYICKMTAVCPSGMSTTDGIVCI